jgi:hypothetical protein
VATPVRQSSPVTYQNIGSQPIQIINAGSGETVAVYNGDITNVLLVSPSSGSISIGNSVPIQPLTTAVIDGTYRQFAVAQTGVVASVSVAPGSTQINPSPAQVAAQISALGLATATKQDTQITNQGTLQGTQNLAAGFLGGSIASALLANPGLTVGQEMAALVASGVATGTPGGTPLLHGYKALQTGQVLAVPAAGNAFTGADLTKVGYEISLSASMAANTATVAILLVRFLWQDPTHTFTLGEENWYIPASSVGSVLTIGKGPSKAPHLVIQITNFDPLVAASVTLTLLESTHHIARDDWRSNNVPNVPDNQVAAGAWPTTPNDPFGFVLASDSIVAAAANTAFHFLLPLYCGQAQLYFSQSVAQAMGASPFMQAFDPAISPNPTNGPTVLTSPAFTTKQAGPFIVNMPRSPCWLGFTTGAAISNISFALIALELTS